MKINNLLFFLIFISNIALGQQFYNPQNQNRVENQVVGNEQKRLNEQKQLMSLIKSNVQFGERLLAKENRQRKRIEEKIQTINNALTEFRNDLSKAKEENEKDDKRIKKLYRSIVKTTLKLDKQKKKFYILKDRIRLIEQSIEKVKKSSRDES